MAKAAKTNKSTINGTSDLGRRSETLFIDARKLGSMVDRTHRELTDDLAKIAGAYHARRGDRITPLPLRERAGVTNLLALGFPMENEP